jgi:hypothetical protein
MFEQCPVDFGQPLQNRSVRCNLFALLDKRANDIDALRSQIVIASSGTADVRSQIATGSKRNIRYTPWAFTEHGALQAANILRSDRAIAMVVCYV